MSPTPTRAPASASDAVVILYTNYRGETAVRQIVPRKRHPMVAPNDVMWFGTNGYHKGTDGKPEPQWFITAEDVGRKPSVMRDFAWSGIKAWGQEAVAAALAPVGVPESVRRVSEAATQGEWRLGRLGDEKRSHVVDMGEPPKSPYMVLGEGAPQERGFKGWPGYGVCHSDNGSSAANAEFIVALVNWFRGIDTPSGRADTPLVSGGAVKGSWFVCIDPDGKPYWRSVGDTREDSLRICFGRYTERHLSDCFEKGWRCEPFTLAAAPAAPEPHDGWTLLPEAVLSSENAHALIVGDAVVVPAAPEPAAGGGWEIGPREVLKNLKTWIDTELPAGTPGAGTAHKAITEALTAPTEAGTAGGDGWRKLCVSDFSEQGGMKLLIARSAETRSWLEPRMCAWDDRHEFWRGWNHRVPPTHCLTIGVPAPEPASADAGAEGGQA